MSYIKRRMEIDSWIDKRSQSSAIALATRSALRALPLYIKEISEQHNNNIKSQLALQAFRFLSLSLYFSVSEDKRFYRASHSKYFDLFPGYELSDQLAIDLTIIEKFELSILNIMRNFDAEKFKEAHIEKSINNLSSVIDSSIQKFDSIYNLHMDAEQLSFRENVKKLIETPTWYSYKETNDIQTNQLKFHLIFSTASHEQWYVWMNWWEDRRDGKPYNIEMEREIVLIPDEDWEQGPAHVNAMIAEIRARYADKDIPADNPVAPRFETAGERIVLRVETPDTAPNDEQVALYDALREQAVELCGLCPENSNRYGAQGKAIAAFLKALGENYASIRLSILWIAGQKMRRFARADDAKVKAGDLDDEPMDPDQSALFVEVVTTYNVFSFGEPQLKAKDEKGRDPALLSPNVSREAKTIRLAVAQSPELFGEEVEPVLAGVIEEAEDPIPGIAARGSVLERETNENFLFALMRKAKQEPKPDNEAAETVRRFSATKVAAAIGAASALPASLFIAVHQTTFLALAEKSQFAPYLLPVIKAIAARWALYL